MGHKANESFWHGGSSALTRSSHKDTDPGNLPCRLQLGAEPRREKRKDENRTEAGDGTPRDPSST